MKKNLLAISLLIFSLFLFSSFVLAETKKDCSDAPGRTIPKLPQAPNDPELIDGNVYPFWGPVCQRYTYSVIYQDKEGRPPEYVQIYFNGKMIDLEKEMGLVDPQSQEKILSYPTDKDWVEQVAISDDGKYFAAKTTNKVLFFATQNPQKPLWEYK